MPHVPLRLQSDSTDVSGIARCCSRHSILYILHCHICGASSYAAELLSSSDTSFLPVRVVMALSSMRYPHWPMECLTPLSKRTKDFSQTADSARSALILILQEVPR